MVGSFVRTRIQYSDEVGLRAVNRLTRPIRKAAGHGTQETHTLTLVALFCKLIEATADGHEPKLMISQRSSPILLTLEQFRMDYVDRVVCEIVGYILAADFCSSMQERSWLS